MPDRRSEVRDLCSDIVELSWKDRFGWNQTATGVLEDISKVGACVQTETTIPLQAEVSFRLRETALQAKIRYCTLIGGGYFVGMEFAEGQAWEFGVSGPRHLFHIPTGEDGTATIN